ncbi:MAG: addiction module protein [Alphaproteobacteria bacterium]|nr:addiction module protein [Alphaproteobacteria bacterium]
MQSRDEILQSLLALPMEDKYIIADALEVDLLTANDYNQAWNEEINRRMEALESGEVKPLDATEMFDRIKRRWGGATA